MTPTTSNITDRPGPSGVGAVGGRAIRLRIQVREVCGDRLINLIDEDPHLFEQSHSLILVLTLAETNRERLELLDYLLKRSNATHAES